MSEKLESLKSLLHYDPGTGIFTWRKSIGPKKKGAVAGLVNGEGYHCIGLAGKKYLAHRLAWLYVYGEEPEGQIDHINHLRADNRISNLRDISDTGNRRNQTRSKHNTSGYVGVSFNNTSKLWMAAIGVSGKSISLGSFKNKQDAINARKAAEKKYGFHPNHGNEKPELVESPPTGEDDD